MDKFWSSTKWRRARLEAICVLQAMATRPLSAEESSWMLNVGLAEQIYCQAPEMTEELGRLISEIEID